MRLHQLNKPCFIMGWLFMGRVLAQVASDDWFYRSDDGYCTIGTTVISYADPQGYRGAVVLTLVYPSKTLANPACYALPTFGQTIAVIYPSDDVVRPGQSANLISASLANIQAADTTFTLGCTKDTGYALTGPASMQVVDALNQSDMIQITSHLYKAGAVRGVISLHSFDEDYQQFLSCVRELEK